MSSGQTGRHYICLYPIPPQPKKRKYIYKKQRRLNSRVSAQHSPSGGSRLGTTSPAAETRFSAALLAAISWAKMLLLPDAPDFPCGAKRTTQVAEIYYLLFLSSLTKALQWRGKKFSQSQQNFWDMMVHIWNPALWRYRQKEEFKTFSATQQVWSQPEKWDLISEE